MQPDLTHLSGEEPQLKNFKFQMKQINLEKTYWIKNFDRKSFENIINVNKRYFNLEKVNIEYSHFVNNLKNWIVK